VVGHPSNFAHRFSNALFCYGPLGCSAVFNPILCIVIIHLSAHLFISWVHVVHGFIFLLFFPLQFPGSLLCDPDATLYGAFGFKRGALASMLPSVYMPMRHGVRNAVGTVSYRHANRDLATTHTRVSRIKTGAVVLENARHGGKLPNVLFREEEVAETGPGCYLDVLPVCGVNGAFVPELDIPHGMYRLSPAVGVCA
jgi:hypothetical protein